MNNCKIWLRNWSLWTDPHFHNIKRQIATIIPSWVAVKVTLKALYLGVLVGPGVTISELWGLPIAKFMARGRFLGSLGLGWQAILRIFNMIMASVLTHVGQVALLSRGRDQHGVH